MSEMENELDFQKLSLEPIDNSEAEKSAPVLADVSNIKTTMTNQLETEAFKSLTLVGYEISENEFKDAVEAGPKSIEYTKLVNYLTNELRVLCNIDECVNTISTPEDSVSFIMEVSSFLNELGCPYASLTRGPVTDRLSSTQDRVLLIQHLVAELMAARILRETRPEKKMELKLEESSQAADLRKVLQTLGFPKPPANIPMKAMMQKLIPTVETTVQKAGNELLGKPLFNGTLSDKQWQSLSDLNHDLHEDFLIRREMLLKRLDCTIQSFQWSDKTRGKDAQFDEVYSNKRKLLKTEPDVDLSDLLASRDDLAIIEKTSSASVRKHTKSAINKVIIGQVPDRGGRTSEQAPPPPEMPPWQQRTSGPAGGRGGGFQGQRGGRGGGQQNSFQSGANYGGSQSSGVNSYSQSSYKSFDSAGTYGAGADYSRGGNTYSGRSSTSRGNNSSYNSGNSTDYSRGGSNFSRASNTSYGGNNSNDYSRGGSGYSRGNKSSYSGGGGSGGNDYNRGSGGYSKSSTDSYSQRNNDYSQNKGGYDSAGSYGGYSSQDYQEPKRAKTFDQFQQNRTTYTDQYVQESQHNQQYHSRDNRQSGGRGRSNYNRGGNR